MWTKTLNIKIRFPQPFHLKIARQSFDFLRGNGANLRVFLHGQKRWIYCNDSVCVRLGIVVSPYHGKYAGWIKFACNFLNNSIVVNYNILAMQSGTKETNIVI